MIGAFCILGITQTILSDYVLFYFAPRSSMLYKVYKKTNTLRAQREIIYLVSKTFIIDSESLQYVFTDGYAIMNFTQYYNDIKNLNRIDWDTMCLKYWRDTSEDNDRRRKRMAEFLVHNHVPIKYIINFPTKQHWRGKSQMVLTLHFSFVEKGNSSFSLFSCE